MPKNGIAVQTPLVYSHNLSKISERDVYLKLENVQPSGSFKLRGISNSCIEKLKAGAKRFVGSSGGNAGLALAYAANQLKVPCRLYIPTSANARMLEKVKAFNADIIVGGSHWAEANEKALEEAKNDPEVTFVHPYDDPSLWEGYADIILSTKEQLGGNVRPSCIVVSVGGGGLLCGLLCGLDKAGWTDIPVVAMETVGADCFNESVKAGRVVVKKPTSVAKCLGASYVSQTLMDWLPKYQILSRVVPDRDAVEAVVRFADDHSLLVEPACGASLAAVYSNLLPRLLDDEGHDSKGPIVIIVCGGSDITPEMLLEYKRDFQLDQTLENGLVK